MLLQNYIFISNIQIKIEINYKYVFATYKSLASCLICFGYCFLKKKIKYYVFSCRHKSLPESIHLSYSPGIK